MIRCVLPLIAVTAGYLPVSRADELQTTLISVERNIHLTDFTFRSRESIPDCPHPITVRTVRLHGGKQDGVDLLILNNGRMEIVIVPTRGMGILSVRLDDVRLGWNSPVRDVVHPKFVNLNSRGGLGWLEGFNEWMCRCGLENNGQPGTDRFINNVGDEAEMELTLHGKIANLPAQEVELLVRNDPPWRITVRSRVDEKMLFGPKLELSTELSTTAGSNTFRILDTVTNAGAGEQEFQILYHANFGPPLLEDGASLIAPLESVTPFNARAAERVDRFASYDGPVAGYVEQVYLLRLYGDQGNRTRVALKNRKGDRAASIAWSLDELPYLTVWKNTGAVADGYVTGLEPGTNYPNNRRVEREFGRVPRLAPGGRQSMSLEFEIHVGKEAVERLDAQISQLQNGRPADVRRAPDAE